MAEALILEFTETDAASKYEAVNNVLGIDMATGQGDWPAGLLMHAGGTSDTGQFIVTEVWASRADQEAFMQQRLGEALAAGGVMSPPTVTWVSLFAHHNLG
jgi:hypothetical protein